MRRDEDLLAGSGGDRAQTVEKLLLKGGVQVRVGLVEKQDVEIRVGRQREHAEPLKEPAALDHEISVSVASVPLELEALDGALDDFDLDIGVVLLAKRGHVELGLERSPEVLLEELPRVGRAEPREVGVGDLRPFPRKRARSATFRSCMSSKMLRSTAPARPSPMRRRRMAPVVLASLSVIPANGAR